MVKQVTRQNKKYISHLPLHERTMLMHEGESRLTNYYLGLGHSLSEARRLGDNLLETVKEKVAG